MNVSTKEIDQVLDGLTAAKIEAHLRFLSSPLLEGRGVGTRGGRLAEEYIRAALAGAGLQPVPGLGYRQEVPMVGVLGEPRLSFETAVGSFEPRHAEEFVLEAGIPHEEVNVTSELIFVG